LKGYSIVKEQKEQSKSITSTSTQTAGMRGGFSGASWPPLVMLVVVRHANKGTVNSKI
jgi:hypothetical protein